MLFIGNKVKVIASAAKGRGAKVRTGSVGYVASISKLHYVPSSRNNSIYATHANIVFTRFGHEHKSRSEPKSVLLIYPAISAHKTKNKINYLEYLIDHVRDRIQQISEIFKKEPVAINKAIPMAVCSINSSTNLSEDRNELVAWLKSIVFSRQLQNILFASKETPENKTLNILTDSSKSKRRVIFEIIKGSRNIEAYATKLYNGDINNLYNFIYKMQELLLLHKLKTLNHFEYKLTHDFVSNKNLLSIYWLYANNGIDFNLKYKELHEQYCQYLTRVKEWSDTYILLSMTK